MKALLTLLILACIPLAKGQQRSFNHWSVEGAIGANKALNPYSSGYSSNSICFPTFDIGARRMLNSCFGVRAETSYSQLKYDHFGTIEGSGYFKTNYWRLTIEGVINLGQVLDFATINPRLGLLGYVGLGTSSLWNDSLKIGVKNGSDEMMHFTAGLSPQYRLNDRLALSLNLRLLMHMYQSRTFDMRTLVQDPGLDGYLVTATVGVNYYLGTAKTHIDWYDESLGMLEQLQHEQTRYDSIVQAMQDDDHDGVANARDEEPGSAEAAVVDVKGVTVAPEAAIVAPPLEPESIDGFVEFPNRKGLFFTIQIGRYHEPQVDLEKRYTLSPLIQVITMNGEVRYLYGIYGRLQDAQHVKDIAFQSGVKDAFVTAYYQGKRITIARAEQLLIAHGRLILEPTR